MIRACVGKAHQGPEDVLFLFVCLNVCSFVCMSGCMLEMFCTLNDLTLIGNLRWALEFFSVIPSITCLLHKQAQKGITTIEYTFTWCKRQAFHLNKQDIIKRKQARTRNKECLLISILTILLFFPIHFYSLFL